MGYVNIKELWYKHQNIARRNVKVRMFVIHSVCEAKVVDNFLEYFTKEVMATTRTENVAVQGEVCKTREI